MSQIKNIPFARVDCSGRETEYVTEVLASGWLTTASKAHQFEENFKELIGCKHALAVNSCTSGLHLALDALGVKRGDKVFVPSHTFTASAEVIRYMGADPIVLDVDYTTSSLSSEIVANAIAQHPEVKVLIGVHYGGFPMPMTGDGGILEICQKAGVRIVEDAAHALPAKLNGRFVGTFGDITCFSFYANKTMTTGEGGMIVTDDDTLAKRIKIMRLHGIDRDVWDRFTSKSATPAWEYDVVAPGFKYNMPDINAAVGLAQFERLQEMHIKRVACASLYFDLLADIEDIELPYRPPTMTDHAWHLFPIRLSPKASITRNQLIEVLGQAGIGTSVHYKPIHQLKYYKEQYDLKTTDFPVSETIWQRSLSLPIYNLLTANEQGYVSDSIKMALLSESWVVEDASVRASI